MSTITHWKPAVAGLLLALSWVAAPVAAQNKIIAISTTEWPPYTGAGLRQGGATTEVIRAAFGEVGYAIRIVYDAWPRAVERARKGVGKVIAYYPGYHCRHREGFVASDPIGHSPLGFAEHTQAPLVWQSLDDIGDRKLKIGTVLGYTNTDEFDAKVGMGWIRAIPSDDDAANLRKLLRRRIDAAVVDKFVLEYLKATDEILIKGADLLRFNNKPLEEKTFYLCFRDDEEGNQLMRSFNSGLGAVEVKRIVESYVTTVVPK